MVRRNDAGATLIELMISLTISSVVMVALVGITSMYISHVNRASARAQLAIDMMMLSDYFSKEIPSAGGELLPVWSGILVENDCGVRSIFPNCAGSDRLSIINTTAPVACSVRASAGGGQLFIDTGGGTCCLDTLNLAGAQVLLTKVANVAQRWVAVVDRNACTVQVAPGPLAFNDNVTEPYDWSGALLIPIQIKTYYLDRNTNELNRFTYADNGTNANMGRGSAIADRVLDFQVALGFDFDPADGVIRDTGNSSDEYMYNAPGTVERLGVGALRDASLQQLRMVALGLVLGQPSQTPNDFGGQRLLDGRPLAAGRWTIERQVSNYMLRSIRTYE